MVCLRGPESVSGEWVALIVLAEGLEYKRHGHADHHLIELDTDNLAHDADTFGEIHVSKGVGDLESRR